MRCIVLADNHTLIDQYYLGEPAFSLYVESDGESILLDCGYSDVFIRNAEKIGIDLSKIKKIVFSHGHNDHTGGLVSFEKEFGLEGVHIYAHPAAFEKRIENGIHIGSPFSAEDLEQKGAVLHLSKKPLSIVKNILFLGEIPPKCKFENRYSIGMMNDRPDFMLDDTAIAVKCNHGIVIMTGCSHSGICNISEVACEVFNEQNIYAIIGGFHLFETGERLTSTICYLQQKKVSFLYPCHCVSLKAKAQMLQLLPVVEVGSGFSFEVD